MNAARSRPDDTSDSWTRPQAKLDALDRRIIDRLHGDFPLVSTPYRALAEDLGIEECDLLARLERLFDDGIATRFGPFIDVERTGGRYCLCAVAAPATRVDAIAGVINGFESVAHHYERDHPFNLWFVIAAASDAELRREVAEIEAATGLEVLALPRDEEFRIDLRLPA